MKDGGSGLPPWVRRRPQEAAESAPGASEAASGPPLTPAQRRLLVAAGAGIPARLLSSRPSQQAQALAQQPLRGAWRAGATYRPALRAAATTALTAAATVSSISSRPVAEASVATIGLDTSQFWSGGGGSWRSLFGWVAAEDRLRKERATRAARNKRADEQRQRARTNSNKVSAARGDMASGALTSGASGSGVDREFAQDVASMLTRTRAGYEALGQCSPPTVLVTAMLLDASRARHQPQLHQSVVVGAGVMDEDLPLNGGARGTPNDEHTRLVGSALLLVRASDMLLQFAAVPEALKEPRVRLRTEVDALVHALVSYCGGPRMTATELRLLAFLLAELHREAMSSRVLHPLTMLGAGPQLGPGFAYLTSMPMLCRIARSAAQLIGVPAPAVSGAGPWEKRMATAVAAVGGAGAAGWRGAEAVMNLSDQRQLMRALGIVHWEAAASAAVNAAAAAAATDSDATADPDPVATTLSSKRSRAGRAYGNAVRTARGGITTDFSAQPPEQRGPPSDPEVEDAAAFLAAKELWETACTAQLKRASVEALSEWLPNAVLRPYGGPEADALHDGDELALRSEALGRLVPRLELARALARPTRPEDFCAVLPVRGAGAAALAVGAAAAANALREWLGSAIRPIARDVEGKPGIVYPLARRSAPHPPWPRAATSLAPEPGVAGSAASAGGDWEPFAWLRSEQSVLSLLLAAGQETEAVYMEFLGPLPGVSEAASSALEAACKGELSPVAVSSISSAVTEAPAEEGDRVASLAAAVEASLLQHRAAVVTVGGGGDGSSEGAPEEERERRRQAAEAELAVAVEALAKVGATRDGAMVVPLPYGGPASSVAVWHTCLDVLTEISSSVMPVIDSNTRRWVAEALSEQERWAEVLEWDDPDPSWGPDVAERVLLADVDSLRSKRTELKIAGLPDRPPMHVALEPGWNARVEAALGHAHCRLLGLEPTPSEHADRMEGIADRALDTPEYQRRKSALAGAAYSSLVRQMMRRQARAVLDVGELAASGIALVVVWHIVPKGGLGGDP
ncbi:hypothetical protein HYH03_009691 [Edaphochlamys debaryana]|uniref:Uncharacterized protein n=1 Tax=Edaphochlamys debaryana TaxID=47281 RepID=A0A835Y3P6_9CHLO|nr:hypothetical protein HYH03_009691 [Edaphochlamys debaryana]|eukprot:KAG2491960.1 hypothetical protein HYH03_009691 [Edaphochlamys debaryana]